MVLPMVRPYAHKKTGMYQLRKVVPASLRALVGKTELKESLGTKSPKEAKDLAGAVEDRFNAILASARAQREGAAVTLSLRAMDAVAGAVYRAEAAKFEDNPGPRERWDEHLGYYGDLFQRPTRHEQDDNEQFAPDRHVLADAESTLRALGIVPHKAPTRRFAERLALAHIRLARVMLRRCAGDWRPDDALDTFPEITSRSPAPAHQEVPSTDLVAA
jgi:hypothetical protein